MRWLVRFIFFLSRHQHPFEWAVFEQRTHNPFVMSSHDLVGREKRAMFWYPVTEFDNRLCPCNFDSDDDRLEKTL